MFCRHSRFRSRRFGRFDTWGGYGDPFGTRWTGRRGGFGFRRRRMPTAARILFAGLLVYAFVKLSSAIGRSNRSTYEKVALGALLAVVGAALLSLRNSSQRYR